MSIFHTILRRPLSGLLIAAATLQFTVALHAQTQEHIRVAIVGLVHGHVNGFLHTLPSHPGFEVVGISEPDTALRQKYQAQTKLPESIFFADETAMLKAVKPQAILVYTAPADHRKAIEAAAPLHIAAMVEKPLATTVADAEAIAKLSVQYNVPVLTNYATTWFPANTAVYNTVNQGTVGEPRKIVAYDGHRGPKEIGTGPEFLGWLTDPIKNGGGAIVDFGCYGIDLTTWLMHGEMPESVTAVTQTLKPDIYSKVDDDSTIILKYLHTQAVIMGSWNWPIDRRDLTVYGSKGYVSVVKTDGLKMQLLNDKEGKIEKATPLAASEDNSFDYLAAVLAHKIDPKGDLTALDTNVKVVRILAAARESARTGRTVTLAR